MIELVTTVGNASASNEADGSIMVSASNGLAPFSYSIDGGQSYQSDPLFTNLLPGFYNVVVIDADSTCSSSTEVEVSFNTGVIDLGEAKVELKDISARPSPSRGPGPSLLRRPPSLQP